MAAIILANLNNRRARTMNEEMKKAAEVVSDPLAYPLLTYLWVLMISAWGGLVRFLNSLRERKETLQQALLTLFIGIVTSTFVGVITFYGCEVAGFERLETAICVAVTGHLGAQAMQFFERIVIQRAGMAVRTIFGGPSKGGK